MSRDLREPYVTQVIEANNVRELNDFLSRELRRIEYALHATEDDQTVKTLESTAVASSAGIMLLDCSATAIVLTLPSAEILTGKEYTIKKIDSGANKVAIRTVGTETIDGVTSSSLTAQYQVKHLISDGTNWHVV